MKLRRTNSPDHSDQPLKDYLVSRQKMVDDALEGFLPKARVKPKTIHQAMRYSLFAGGKRLRPILCLASAEACGGEPEPALPLACAVECIHTYSLIHDDLPCMDNDDFRRGMPTSHKVYGEGIAVLAGDALLTIAFELAALVPGWPRYGVKEVVRELASASGSRRLIGGQVADLESEGQEISLSMLRFIHESKTAALLTAAIRLGAMSANATERQLEKVTTFGKSLGLAFQVIDDILDVTQTAEKLGKSAGKDLTAEKATYPALLGLQRSKKFAQKLTQEAHRVLEGFGRKADHLHGLADHLLAREY